MDLEVNRNHGKYTMGRAVGERQEGWNKNFVCAREVGME